MYTVKQSKHPRILPFSDSVKKIIYMAGNNRSEEQKTNRNMATVNRLVKEPKMIGSPMMGYNRSAEKNLNWPPSVEPKKTNEFDTVDYGGK